MRDLGGNYFGLSTTGGIFYPDLGTMLYEQLSLARVQDRMTRVIRGLESMVYEEGSKEFGLFSLGENRLRDRHSSSLSICKSLLQKV